MLVMEVMNVITCQMPSYVTTSLKIIVISDGTNSEIVFFTVDIDVDPAFLILFNGNNLMILKSKNFKSWMIIRVQ